MDIETVDARSTIALFEALERARSTMSRVHVFLDNARYHHAKAVQGWLQQPGRRIVLHLRAVHTVPHLDPIEPAVEGDPRERHPQQDAYAKFRDFAEAVLGFLRQAVTAALRRVLVDYHDNFRVIDPKEFGSSRDAAIEACLGRADRPSPGACPFDPATGEHDAAKRLASPASFIFRSRRAPPNLPSGFFRPEVHVHGRCHAPRNT